MTFKYDYGTDGGQNFVSTNPAKPTQEVGRYAKTTDIDGMVAKAKAAQKIWAKMPGLERGNILNAWLDAVVARADEIAEAVCLEQGKTLPEAKGETLKGCAEGRFMVGEAARMGSQQIATGRPNFSNQILRKPRGVIMCVSPWNFPAMTPLRKICPAVAFGNAVLLKPSQFTPAAAYILADIAKGHFPEGLIQIAMISGRETSELVSFADIQGVSFTGSVDTGRLVAKAAAENLIPAQLELGGKNAAILNDTHDLDDAVTKIFGAAFQTCGQRCTSISRVLVHKDLAAETKRLLVDKANHVKLGEGINPEATMGPLCNEGHWNDVMETTAQAIDEGAVALCGGMAPAGSGPEGGFFFEPTILANVAHKSIAGQVEIFGPVLSVIEYETFDEAMDILNDTEFGLTSALFSNDNSLVQRFLAESDNGMLHVNHGTVPDNNMPFGGVKNSGVGPYSVGPTAINFYTSEHAAYIAY